jgi:agmatinase
LVQGRRYGLAAAASIVDCRISTFSPGELSRFSGVNTFRMTPY